MEDFQAMVVPRPADMGVGIRGQLPPNIFCAPTNFVVLRKICFKQMIKPKIFPPPKSIFCPQTLKPGYVPDSAKIMSAIRIFCLKAIRPRDVA